MMKIVKISLVVLLAISSCGLQAMHFEGDGLMDHLLLNEGGLNEGPRREAPAGRPADFYDAEQIRLRALEAYPLVTGVERRHVNTDDNHEGWDEDVDLGQVAADNRASYESAEKMAAITRVAEEIPSFVKVAPKEGGIPEGFKNNAMRRVNGILKGIKKSLTSSFKQDDLINNDEGRIKVRALVEEAKSLRIAIEKDLGEGTKNVFRQRKNRNVIEQKIAKLEAIAREIETFLKEGQAKEESISNEEHKRYKANQEILNSYERMYPSEKV